MPQDIEISRRGVLAGGVGGALGVALFAGATGSAAVAVPTGRGRATFLGPEEMATLTALVDRVVPGRPEDTTPGAVEAGCAEAIDALLGAFTVSPPRIYAGGPFSDRAGSRTNHFAEFLPLDRYERKAWRLRIEGSRGRRALERNGPVTGYQKTYRRGLRALEAAAPGGFSTLPGPARDLALRTVDDERVSALLDLAVTHTLEFMYGAPEYGGNRRLVGWTSTGFEGDVQPRGWTDEEVTSPESSGPLDLVTDLLGVPGMLPLAALGSVELVHGARARSHDGWNGLRDEVRRLTRPTGELRDQLDRIHRQAQQLASMASERER